VEQLSGQLRGDGAQAVPLGERIQQALLDGRIPQAVLEAILHAAARLRLGMDAEGVIVRSSATVEDDVSHSFAGIFDSIPIMGLDLLEPTIRSVWASLFSPRALAYMAGAEIRQVPGMAVVVQRFLEATRSGVMFTRFSAPDGMSRILVEHVEGGCEKLVKGEVTPARLWLGGPDRRLDDPRGVLAAVHTRELARLAGSVEEVFGAAQDVEWVLYDDAIHLVQSRPITAAAREVSSVGAVAVGRSRPPLLTGVPASGGAGGGNVHLVFNIEQALRLEKGQVLVTPMTNPDMVVAMRNSAAIVTDVGGMICHAAIVSRELGLPCVVGTETATSSVIEGEPVTVDGTRGNVYRGLLTIDGQRPPARPAAWTDLWSLWTQAVWGRSDLVPIVSTVEALEAMPEGLREVVLSPDVDLRTDHAGLWNDLESMSPADRARALDEYFGRVLRAAGQRSVSKLYLLPLGTVSRAELSLARDRAADPRLRMCDDPDAPAIILDPAGRWPTGAAAVPLGCAAAVRPGINGDRIESRLGGPSEAVAAGIDTIKFFGHRPRVKSAGMPDATWRAGWWTELPEYARFHLEHATAAEGGTFDWLEVRPELVISPLLKSLVQPGFEMVPRVMGFKGLAPMHIKWIRCRYHFRADTFAKVWEAIVRATWDEGYMADLMRRVRASYGRLEEVLCLFPGSDAELAAIDGRRMVALLTSWWPRWVEFFALCWFIQAQGDDVAYPFIDETVKDNLARCGEPPAGFDWPGASELVAPTLPTLSGDYMADVGLLREELLAAGLSSPEEAVAALNRGEHAQLAGRVQEHLRKWRWMRDRDLLFEPWDTPIRVIETALKTEPHAAQPYRQNLRHNLLALGFHCDLAHVSGRALALNHFARFLHDLNVERENHHVLWLKYSYALRCLVLEIERRLIAPGGLQRGDVFFLQAPELIEAARELPSPLPDALIGKVRNRRAGFRHEARLAEPGAPTAVDEDDYY
jgi:phosphohistidine swiveling domain-containing protein